jgi:hypothetical protein
MRSRFCLTFVLFGALAGLGAGCGSKTDSAAAPTGATPKKLTAQQMEARVQEIQNNPVIPADEKTRLIAQLRARGF